jgi:hypothetical protein
MAQTGQKISKMGLINLVLTFYAGFPLKGRPLRQGVGVRIQIFDRSKDNFEFKVQKQSLFSYF